MNFRRRERLEVSPNLTPLIDVVFILLIFFMVSTTFTRETRLGVELPEANAEPASTQPLEVLEIVVSADGTYAVNGQTLVNERATTLRAAIQAAVDEPGRQPVVIHGDAQAPHGAVVRAMDVLGRLGVSNIRIAARRPESGE